MAHGRNELRSGDKRNNPPDSARHARASSDLPAAAPGIPSAAMNEATTGAPAPDAGRSLAKSALFLAPVLAIGLVFALTGLSPAQLAEKIPGCPPALFFVFGAIAPLFGFPLASLYAYAGIKYGFAEGFALCVPMVAANLAIAHPIYGKILRRPVLAMLAKRGWHPENMRHRNRLRMTLLIASMPALPFWAQNATLAALAVPFPLFFTVSLGLQTMFAAGVVSLGALGTRAPGWSVPLIVAVIGTVALATYIPAIRRRFRRR